MAEIVEGGGEASLLVQYFTLILAYSHLYWGDCDITCSSFLSWGMLLGRTNDQNLYP